MDFHGMNRKNLQILCKKHGIPANLKSIEMANRLASLFQKEDEETVTETKISPEEDDDGMKEEEANVVASRKAKKVRFSPESDNQVFEFTRSVKKTVRTRRSKHGTGKAIQQDGSIELRRSKRTVSNGDVSNSVTGIVEDEKGPAANSVKVTRRSNRIGSIGSAQNKEGKDTALIASEQLEDKDIQGGRRSRRLAAKIEEGGTSKSVTLLPPAKRSKRIGSSGSTQEEGKDTDVNAPQRFDGKDIQEGRRSRRLAAKIEKSFEEVGTSKFVTLLPATKRSKRVVDVANNENEKETGVQHRKDGDSKVAMMRRRSMRFVKDADVQTNTQDQRRSVRLKASVADPLMGQAKNGSVEASKVVKGTLVDKKTDENLVKSSKRVTRNMKRDRSAEPEVDSGTASNQRNLTPKKTLEEFAHFEQEETCGADVKAGGSSKKGKTMNQECIKDKPQGIIVIEDSPSSSKTKAAEPVMIVEKVSDPTLDKSDDSPQRSNSRELNCESMEGECENKLERDTILMPVMEEDKEEVTPRSLSSPKDKLLVPTGHITSTVIAEESTKTKDEPVIYAPESELKEHSSLAKLANVEEILENSTERWKEIHSSEDDEKGFLEKDVQAENLLGKFSEYNSENSSAEEELEISKVGGMSAGDCVTPTPEKNSGEYAHLEREEAERPNVEARSCSQKMKKIVGQEFGKDKAQGMAEDSLSTSETKDTEPVMISENVLASTRKVSGDTSAVRNSHELNSELLEEKHEEKHAQVTDLLAATEKDKEEEASSPSEFLIERSEVKTSPRNCSTGYSLSVDTTLASVQLAMSNQEADLGLPTGNDIVSTVITEEDKITKEETLISTPTSVAKLTKVEAILGNLDEKGSLEKDVQAEEEMEISKVDYMSVNLTPEKVLDAYTHLVPEEAAEPNVKTVSSEFVKENPQGIAEDSPSTSETKPTEPIMMSENVLDSTSKVSVDISLVRNTREVNSELEEKHEEDIVLMAATKKDEEEASSLFMQTTPPPPSSVQTAVSNPESELSVPTGNILVRDIVSAVIAEEEIKTEEVPKSVQSFVATFAETDVLENSAECWNESLSSKDDDRGSLEKEKQSAKRHENFSEYNAESSSADEQADICKVGRISDGHCADWETLDEVKDESLMKSVQTISRERGCKLNALELSGSLSTEFASHSHKDENVSECLEEEEMKALSQPIPIKEAASNVHDRSSLFTTPERNLMLMEQLSEGGKICAAHIVTQHNDEAVESHTVVFTTAEKVLLLGDSGLDEVGKEEEHTTTDFPDDLNTTRNEAFNEDERIVVKLHDEPNIAASPSRQSSVGNFKEDRTERNEANGTVELHCESGTCSGPDKHAALANFVSDGAEISGGNKAIDFYEESVVFTGLEERRKLFGYSGQGKDREGAVEKAAQIYEEAGLSTELEDPECEVGWLGINNADESGRLEEQFLYGDTEQKKAEKAPAEFHDESAVQKKAERHPFPEESELEEAAKSEENKFLELPADCDNFTAANINAKSHNMSDVLTASESHTLLKESELEEATRSEENEAVELQVDSDNFTGVSITAKSHVLTNSDSHSLMGDFEPEEEENKDVELLGESNISTDVERHLLSEEFGLAETRKIKYNTAATCEESFVFISPERRQHLGNSEPHTAGKQERKEVEFKDESAFFTRLETRLLLGESGSAQYQSHCASSPKVILKDDSVVREGHVASPDFKENTIADFSGSIASKVSYSHELRLSAGEDTARAGCMPKASQTENVVGLDAKGIQGWSSKQSRENSPHVDSVNHFDFDTRGADTIMDAERNVSFSSYVLALPAGGNSETICENSNHIEVAGTCSLVSDAEESGSSTDIQNPIHDALEELAVTDELIDAKVTKNTENDPETIGEISSQLEVTGTCSMVSEKSIPSMDIENHINDALEEELAVTDNNKAEVTKNVDSSGGSDVFGRTCVLAGTEDEHLGYSFEVTDPADTAFEKDISLAPDESTLQKNRNEEAVDDNGEATPSPEETLVKPSENIGESGKLFEKQVRREPILIYRTQAKPKRHDMKENATNSKIVDNLNVTAPRASKRQPLQDLRKK